MNESNIQYSNDELDKGEMRDYRKELWIGVAIAYANSSNSTHIQYMAKWADHALAEYDKRFDDGTNK